MVGEECAVLSCSVRFPFAEFLEARIFCPYDSFGSKFVEPGEKHRDWKSGRQRDDNKTHRGVRNFKKREDLRCELGEEPCDYFVGDCCPVNITPLQLREDVLWVYSACLGETLAPAPI
jgi:hypothetical protein